MKNEIPEKNEEIKLVTSQDSFHINDKPNSGSGFNTKIFTFEPIFCQYLL